MTREYVTYNGKNYYVQSSGRYYNCSHSKPRLLHRKVWTDINGDIALGYVIHHKDHDWRNNNISNLELVERKQHCIDHFKEREMINIKCKECGKDHATPFSSRTLYCSNYCSQKRKHDRYKTDIRKCIECNKEFEAHRHRKVKCCGYKCSSKRRGRISKIAAGNHEKECAICSIKFNPGDELRTITCSRSCGAKMRWKNKKAAMM